MKILHIVGGSPNSGAYKGAEILHNALIKLGVKSKFLNDSTYIKNNSRIIFLKRNFFQNILYKINVSIEKILKTIFLHSPRSTFSFCLLGDDITKFQEYKEIALEKGFRYVESGPLVRSSYHADQDFAKLKAARIAA